MPTLAPKLPYTHPFAGGYPRLGGQPLPTDPDAIDYLERVKAADGGVGVEVAVAVAVDDFFRGMKADGIWDAIKASCILCGARTISGALVPLVGTAPTPYNFVAADYDRSGGGLKGDGSTKYLTAGIGYNEIASNDEHLSTYISTATSDGQNIIGGGTGSPTSFSRIAYATGRRFAVQVGSAFSYSGTSMTGFAGVSRASAANLVYRAGGATVSDARASAVRSSTPAPYGVFCANYSDNPAAGLSDARLAFYSIGSSLDLAALDTRVSTLVAAIAAAL